MKPGMVERAVYKGVPASKGLAKAPLFLWYQEQLSVPDFVVIDPDGEIKRLAQARGFAADEIEALIARTLQEIGSAEAAVFEAHAMLLDDVELVGMAEAAIVGHQNAEKAWMDAIEFFAKELFALPDPTFQQRAMDVRDVGRRVLAHLLKRSVQLTLQLTVPSLVVAYDLTPSQTSLLDTRMVRGFCTAAGGPTSHSAILAKALGIPAVVAFGESLMALPDGVNAILDGERGELIVAPNQEDEMNFQVKTSRLLATGERELAAAGQPAVTLDGRRLEVVANIGSREDALFALQKGAEGVGLFRTEFLFLDRQTEPTEEEQFQAYQAVFETMGTLPVVVRTLDAGGDKAIPYLQVKPESNPFLGWRAIRVCLDQVELFKKQLRALLRAGAGHDLRIMFPMIATLEEVRKSRHLLEECKLELRNAGMAYTESPQIGIMAEIPSVVVMADQFVREVDFFSVGTNDLTQYTMAAERTNEKVAYLGDACHPAILRQIDHVVRAAHAKNKWVGVCGELAGDPAAIPILVGLGVDELSMSPNSIPHAKAMIRALHCERAQALAKKAMEMPDAQSVRKAVTGPK